MKTKREKGTWACIAALLLTAAAPACSDGELQNSKTDFNIAAATPNIIAFYAEPKEVKANETATISWEVANADSVRITARHTPEAGGDEVPFDVTTDKLEGSLPTPPLTATTEFTLTASKTAVTEEASGGEAAKGFNFKADAVVPVDGDSDSNPPSATEASQKITVMVVQAASPLTATITADKDTLSIGEETVIRWKVAPKEGVAVEVTADSNEAIIPTDACEGGIEAIRAATPAETAPAVGCAVVAPGKRTTYTVTATSSKDQAVAQASVVIDIEGEEPIALEIRYFKVNQQENAVVSSYDDPVLLEWSVVPKGALVTIVAESDAVTPDIAPPPTCDLPKDKPSIGEKEELSCQIAADTRFTITARIGKDSTPPQTVMVSRRKAGSADIMITSDAWAFEGEVVDVTIEPVGEAGMIQGVSISDASQSNGMTVISSLGGAVTKRVAVPPTGVRVSWQCQECEVKERDVLAVPALPLAPKAFRDGATALPVTSIKPLPGTPGVFLHGVDRGSFGKSKGVGYIFKSGAKLEDDALISVGYGDLILSVGSIKNYTTASFLEKVHFPLSAIAVTDKGRIYAGTSGAVLYSDDMGAKWKLLAFFPGYADGRHPYPTGKHPSCAGELQEGIAVPEGAASFKVATFSEICDLRPFGDKGLMIAMDRGVLTIDDVESFTPGQKMKGVPADSSYEGRPEFLTYTLVANALQQVSGQVFAAASKGSGTAAGGVFVTGDNGTTWSAFGLDGKDVYSLAYDEQSGTLYAGTAEGVFASGASSPAWNQVGSLGKAVFSLAVDPYSYGGVLIAGTQDGVSVLRGVTKGREWSDVSKAGKVRAIGFVSTVDSEKRIISHYLSIGTPAGAMSGSVAVSAKSVIGEPIPIPLPPPVPPDEPEPPLIPEPPPPSFPGDGSTPVPAPPAGGDAGEKPLTIPAPPPGEG